MWSLFFTKIVYYPTSLKPLGISQCFPTACESFIAFLWNAKKKFINWSKHLTKTVKNWIFFQSLCVGFFQKPSFLGQKCDVTSKMLLPDHVVLWPSDWGNTEKCKKLWVSSILQLASIHEYKSQFFQLVFNQIHSTCRRVVFGKSVVISAIGIQLSQKLNWLLSATLGLISTIKNSTELQKRRSSLENHWYWSLHRNFGSSKFPENCL